MMRKEKFTVTSIIFMGVIRVIMKKNSILEITLIALCDETNFYDGG